MRREDHSTNGRYQYSVTTVTVQIISGMNVTMDLSAVNAPPQSTTLKTVTGSFH